MFVCGNDAYRNGNNVPEAILADYSIGFKRNWLCWNARQNHLKPAQQSLKSECSQRVSVWTVLQCDNSSSSSRRPNCSSSVGSFALHLPHYALCTASTAIRIFLVNWSSVEWIMSYSCHFKTKQISNILLRSKHKIYWIYLLSSLLSSFYQFQGRVMIDAISLISCTNHQSIFQKSTVLFISRVFS